MTSSSFTTRIDSDLKKSLEQIAKYEDRSASWVANKAIKAFVEEREATRALIETGLALVEKNAPAISSSSVHHWLKDNGAEEFPEAVE